jgi:hypothetical protein
MRHRRLTRMPVTGDKFSNLTAVFNFNEDRASFTGHDLDRNRKVTISPRVGVSDQ